MIKRMVRRVGTHVYNRYRKENDESLFLMFFIVSCAVLVSACMHVCLIGFYLFLNLPPLVYLNILSLAIHLLCVALIRGRNFSMAGIVLTLEILYYTTLSIYFLGTGNYILVYLLVLAVLQIVMPYTRRKLRFFAAISVWLVAVVLAYTGAGYVPPLNIGQFGALPTVFNLNLGTIALVLEVSIGNYARRIISGFQKQKIESYKTQAYTDELTALYNRRYATIYFAEILPKDPYADQKFCAMLDIDNFKMINDTYGHAVGDVVLQTLSRTIAESFRKQDILFRWGGEEFLLIIDRVDAELAVRILEKLRQKIAALSIPQGDETLHITVTIGVARLNRDDVWESINACDQKMYRAKRSGKNRVSI